MPDTADQLDSLVTLLEMAGVNVDAHIGGGWTSEECDEAAAWANAVIAVADALEEANRDDHEGPVYGIDFPEIPECLTGLLDTPRQLGGTAACVRELIEDRAYWAELKPDAEEPARSPEPRKDRTMAKKRRSAKGGTATLEPPPAKKIERVNRTIPVRFGTAGIGKKDARLSLAVAGTALSLEDAQHLLCERQLTVTIKTGDGQRQLEGMEDEDHVLSRSVVRTKDLKVGPEQFGSGLTFARSELERGSLEGFVGREGRMTIHDVRDIPEDAKKRGRPRRAAANGDGEPAEEAAGTIFGSEDEAGEEE